jgi:hypothetical protein
METCFDLFFMPLAIKSDEPVVDNVTGGFAYCVTHVFLIL